MQGTGINPRLHDVVPTLVHTQSVFSVPVPDSQVFVEPFPGFWEQLPNLLHSISEDV